MRTDVLWCSGTGESPLPGTLSPGVGRVTRDRGRCPACDRRLSCPRGRMAPHAWSPQHRSRLQVQVEDRHEHVFDHKALCSLPPVVGK